MALGVLPFKTIISLFFHVLCSWTRFGKLYRAFAWFWLLRLDSRYACSPVSPSSPRLYIYPARSASFLSIIIKTPYRSTYSSSNGHFSWCTSSLVLLRIILQRTFWNLFQCKCACVEVPD